MSRVRGAGGRLARNVTHKDASPADCHKSPARHDRRRGESVALPLFESNSGIWTCASSNGSPPRKRQSSMRAFNSGSSGEVNGNLSIITNDNVSPRTSTPSQKLLVATRSALPALTNCCNSCPLLVSPCNNTGSVMVARNCWPIAHHGVRGTKHKTTTVVSFDDRSQHCR